MAAADPSDVMKDSDYPTDYRLAEASTSEPAQYSIEFVLNQNDEATDLRSGTSLPGINVYMTTHDEQGLSKLHSKRDGNWAHMDDKKVGVSYVYTHPSNPDLSEEKDLQESDDLIGGGKVGLTREDGTNVFYVDFSPGYQYALHRTVSLDMGIVLEGTIEMGLEDGSATLMRKGDVAVQRGTLHSWKNASSEDWARMIFILHASKPVKAGEKTLEAT